MYKKRIRLWRLAKNMKADEKEHAIAECVLSAESVNEMDTMPSSIKAKVLRHALDLVKAGKIERGHLRSIINRNVHDSHGIDQSSVQPSWHFPATVSIRQDLGHSMTLNHAVSGQMHQPTNFANIERLIWALRESVQMVTGPQDRKALKAYQSLVLAMSNGQQCYQKRALALTRENFVMAGRIVNDISYTRPEVLPLVLYNIDAYRVQDGNEFIDTLSRYVAKATRDNLEANHFSVIFAQTLGEQALDDCQREVLLDCIIKNANPSGQSEWIQALWLCVNFARCKSLMREGHFDRCIQLCTDGTTRLERAGRCTISLQIEVKIFLSKLYALQCNTKTARRVLEEVCRSPDATAWQKTGAWRRIARLHESLSELDQAKECYAEAARIHTTYDFRYQWDSLGSLLNFCRRYNLKTEAFAYISEFAESYRCLLEESGGLWDVEFESWIADGVVPRDDPREIDRDRI